MDDIKAKQQIIDKIKDATNILVTVSDNPTVDALSAAIGLTLLIDKMDKHSTAIFSGVVPPAIAFLEPEKILDDTTDSLRDFIIALDKEKADHLRYKLEGDSVKIFITPYKTAISSDDLQFSQGDYNVELVIALGVDNQDHLDKALEAHGKILHDATVATITAGTDTSDLGGIDWHDDKASSLSEMATGIAEAMKGEKGKSLLDSQIATALLTGIVAQTERFSNRNTSPKSMTAASNLMAAGADQQLIASKLEGSYDSSQVNELDQPKLEDSKVLDDGTLKINNDSRSSDTFKPTSDQSLQDSLNAEHPVETLEEMDRRVKQAEQAEAADAAESALDQVATPPQPEAPAVPLPEPTPIVTEPVIEPAQPEQPLTLPSMNPDIQPGNSTMDAVPEPTLGGTLNATTEQAAEDARREALASQNHTILSHAYMQGGEQSPNDMLMAPNEGGNDAGGYILTGEGGPHLQPPEPAPNPLAPPPANDFGLPMPPPVPDFSQAQPGLEPPLPVAPQATGPYAPLGPQPERLGDILEEPAVPSAPAPQEASEFNPFDAPAPAAAPAPQPLPPEQQQPTGPYAPPPAEPGQFKIPGQ